MKLKDILARELKAWPEGSVAAVQQNITDDRISFVDCMDVEFSCGQWDYIDPCLRIHDQKDPHEFERASDWETSVVTRAEWQAAVDALKAEQESEPAIDWSKQPKGFPLWLEGTTEEHRKHSGWYRKNGEVYLAEIAGQWRASREGQFFTVHTRPVNPPVAAEKAVELKWPDGATHYVPPQEKNENGVFYLVFNDNAIYSWALLKSGVDNGGPVYGEVNRHHLPGTITRPTERDVEWDGVSVPPAGTECEYRVGHGGWFKCSIRYVTTPYHDCPVEVVMFAYHLGCEQTGVVGSGEGELEFRSIRTQEQIEAEEREKAIEEIRKDTDYILDEICASAVLAAGYRKQVAE